MSELSIILQPCPCQCTNGLWPVPLIPRFTDALMKDYHFTRAHCRVFLKTQNVSDRAPNGGYAVSICGGTLNFFLLQIFISIFDRICAFVFLAVLLGKWPKNSPKLSKFHNLLKTHPKVVNKQNTHVIHHIEGMLALKSSVCFLFWHL